MKKLISLAIVLAFFVIVPQCLGQSQDAEKDAAQLLTEQQLVQMFHLVMAQGKPENKICHLSPRSPWDGFVRLVNERSVQGHLNHGDCEQYGASPDEPGEPCDCSCGPGEIPPCSGR